MEQSIGPSSFAALRSALLDNPFAQVAVAAVTADKGAARRAPQDAARAGSASGDEAPSRRPERLKGFLLEMEGAEPLVCGDVRGFREAIVAAFDPRAPVPTRLQVVGAEGVMCAWLEGWAEDSDRVRRTVTIRRRFDNKSITVIATLCSFGYGVETSLAVESVFAPQSGGEAIATLRSGVHSKADVEAALARFDAEESGAPTA